jgi:hypothetical protein
MSDSSLVNDIYKLMKRFREEDPDLPIRVFLIKFKFSLANDLDRSDPIFTEVRALFEANGEEDLTRYLVTEDEWADVADGLDLVSWAPSGDERIMDPEEERRKAHEHYKEKR